MRKPVIRRCVATQENYPKAELIRIVRCPNGEIQIDETGKMNGRGAYLNRSLAALQIAKKKKALERSLNCSIPNEIYETLESYIKNE